MVPVFDQFDSLSPEQRRLIAHWLAEEAEADVLRESVLPAPPIVSRTAPASFAQQRLWFLSQFHPERSTYHLRTAVRLAGPIVLGALRDGLVALVQRHATLRTRFRLQDGVLFQVIDPPGVFGLPVFDLTGLFLAVGDPLISVLAREWIERPFDLEGGPLFRPALVRCAVDVHVLLLPMHHAVGDGWSIGVLLRDLAVLYARACGGAAPDLPVLVREYVDYAVEQRRADVMRDADLAYWCARFASLPPPLVLPADRPPPPHPSERGAVVFATIPLDVLTPLHVLRRRSGATLFMVLVAALAVLLARSTGERDLVIATPIAGRTHADWEPLIGLFANLLALRVDLYGDPSLLVLLEQVRAVVLDAFAHQGVPFEQVLDALPQARAVDAPPLFRVLLALQNTPTPRLDTPFLHGEPIELFTTTAVLDLALYVREVPAGLHVRVEYATDLFDVATIQRVIAQYQEVLLAFGADSGQRVSAVPLLTAGERAQVAVWGRAMVESPRDVVLPMVLLGHAVRIPDAVALVMCDESGWVAHLTYADLVLAGCQLAGYLGMLGVGPDQVVGVLLERSLLQVIALVGVWFAGGAYVPFDPTAPDARMATMLMLAQVRVLLLRAGGGEVGQGPWLTVALDQVWAVIRGLPLPSLPSFHAAALAYVICTSGSTGVPKGVAVSHGALGQFAAAAAVLFGLQPEDRVLQFASISFDTAAEELYPCLWVGGTLVLRHAGLLDSPQALMGGCATLGVTVVDLPTAYWQQLMLDEVTRGLSLPMGLRLMVIGGEAAAADRVAHWQRWVGTRVQLVNSYGPTEATVAATAWVVPPAMDAPLEVRIGRPLGAARVYVVDGQFQPVGVGVMGEVYLGGGGLARGYVGQPDMTAERFVPNPFAEPGEEGTRLYRTGDRGCWRVDGTLVYGGRVDAQVKLRGYRIEPEEVASVLRGHAAVREAVVMVRVVRGDEQQLVAYVVLTRGEVTGEDLRTYVGDRLPGYMVPAAVVIMAELPLTARGKIDRAALPAPEVGPRLGDAPRTPTEVGIARIWAEVLGCAAVGAQDSFFALGGHSLLATQVLTRVRAMFGVALSLRAFFEAPTVAGLAQQVDVLRWAVQELQTAPIDALADDEQEGEL